MPWHAASGAVAVAMQTAAAAAAVFVQPTSDAAETYSRMKGAGWASLRDLSAPAK